jgi:hypothetical protein
VKCQNNAPACQGDRLRENTRSPQRSVLIRDVEEILESLRSSQQVIFFFTLHVFADPPRPSDRVFGSVRSAILLPSVDQPLYTSFACLYFFFISHLDRGYIDQEIQWIDSHVRFVTLSSEPGETFGRLPAIDNRSFREDQHSCEQSESIGARLMQGKNNRSTTSCQLGQGDENLIRLQSKICKLSTDETPNTHRISVQSTGGLIQHDDRRKCDQDTSDTDTPPFTA